MRHFASDLLTARQIDFKFRALDFDRDAKVGANVRREFFLIFKEGVNNIARHSACTEAEIELHAFPDSLVLKLSDNGKGFDLSEQATGHGLASMRERTRSLGGDLEINSVTGKGTTLSFTIPLNQSHEQAATGTA
jgi:signal transduction histidine kinase